MFKDVVYLQSSTAFKMKQEHDIYNAALFWFYKDTTLRKTAEEQGQKCRLLSVRITFWLLRYFCVKATRTS